jgi:large subunit ribosomal protein L31
MKKDIHPRYVDASVRCACGNTMTTRSTLHDIKVEVCSNCHPAYTGVRKATNAEGRIERFRRRYQLREDARQTLPS